MSKIAFIYPGQGAQAVGMGQDFYENSPLSKAVFDQASEAVSLDLKKLCFEENDLLNKTEYTQVAMVTACIAMTRAVEAMLTRSLILKVQHQKKHWMSLGQLKVYPRFV